MGMAEDALESRRLQDAVAQARREREEALTLLRKEWVHNVDLCVPEFLQAARELHLKADKKSLFRRTWLVDIPIESEPNTTEPGWGVETQTVAVHSTGTWERVIARRPFSTSGRPTLIVRPAELPVHVRSDSRVPFELIRTNFVSRLSRG